MFPLISPRLWRVVPPTLRDPRVSVGIPADQVADHSATVRAPGGAQWSQAGLGPPYWGRHPPVSISRCWLLGHTTLHLKAVILTLATKPLYPSIDPGHRATLPSQQGEPYSLGPSGHASQKTRGVLSTLAIGLLSPVAKRNHIDLTVGLPHPYSTQGWRGVLALLHRHKYAI